MASDSLSSNDKPYWTCRLKRLKCDRLLPTCRKCAISNLQCLGYGQTKLLRWTNSIASRGEMMSKTFDVKKLKTIPPAQHDDVQVWRGHGPNSLSSSWMGMDTSISPSAELLNFQERTTESGHAWRQSQETLQGMRSHPTFDLNCGSLASKNLSTGNVASLTDPGLQDLTPASRNYISYCR